MHAKRLTQDHIATSLVRQDAHLMQTSLIQSSDKEVDGKPACSATLCQRRIKLCSFRVVSGVVVILLHIHMRANRLSKLLAHHHPRSNITGPAAQEHDPRSCFWHTACLQEANGNGQGSTSATEWSAASACGPCILRQVVQERVQSKLTLARWNEEAPCCCLANEAAGIVSDCIAKLVSNLLASVLFSTPECVRLRECVQAQLMNIAHRAERYDANLCIVWHHCQ
mmetsp:Transcript_43851/g.80090  ORF Transcript_43851/g.80090 Transcript_43851/m.80090 type:complete len:225 (+) Transcript_43851:1302-1976(+)